MICLGRSLPVLLAPVLLGASIAVPIVLPVAAVAGPTPPVQVVMKPGPDELSTGSLRLGGEAFGRSAAGATGVVEVQAPLTMVAATWRSGARAEVRVRAHASTGWGPWTTLEPSEDGPNSGERTAKEGSGLVWLGRSDRLRVQVAPNAAPGLSLHLFDSAAVPGRTMKKDPAQRTTDSTKKNSPKKNSAKKKRLPARPRLRSRAAWGANEKWRDGMQDPVRRIKQVHVHHTVNSNEYRRADVPGILRAIYRYHTRTLSWSDVGYNFLVDRFGRAWVGRKGSAGRTTMGAHTLGFNNTSVGVAVIGNYETATPSRRVLRTIGRLAAWKLAAFGHDRAIGKVRVRSQGSDLYPPGTKARLPRIDGHRDTNQTACPGQELYDRLPTIRRIAQKRLRGLHR